MKPKKKFSSEVMFPLIKEYLSGNVSRMQFCGKKEIKPHVLQYWLKKYNTASKESGIPSFSPIQIKNRHESLSDQNELDTANRHIVIKTSTGLEIQIPV